MRRFEFASRAFVRDGTGWMVMYLYRDRGAYERRSGRVDSSEPTIKAWIRIFVSAGRRRSLLISIEHAMN